MLLSRSADAEPQPKADAEAGFYGGYYGHRAYGYGMSPYYGHHAYGYGYPAYSGYGFHYGKRFVCSFKIAINEG